MKTGELLKSKHIQHHIKTIIIQLCELIWQTHPVWIILIAIGIFLWCNGIIIGKVVHGKITNAK